MASKTIKIPNFPKNWFMLWDMYTQAAFEICVTLKDNTKTYVNNACQASTNPKPPLAEGSDFIAGNNLEIMINIPQSPDIYVDINAFAISRPDGTVAGNGFVLCVEDWNDRDYNDLFVSMACWYHKG